MDCCRSLVLHLFVSHWIQNSTFPQKVQLSRYLQIGLYSTKVERTSDQQKGSRRERTKTQMFAICYDLAGALTQVAAVTDKKQHSESTRRGVGVFLVLIFTEE